MNTKEPISDIAIVEAIRSLQDKKQIEIACDFIKLKRVLSDLNFKIHTGYDFNADPEQITLAVSAALNL